MPTLKKKQSIPRIGGRNTVGNPASQRVEEVSYSQRPILPTEVRSSVSRGVPHANELTGKKCDARYRKLKYRRKPGIGEVRGDFQFSEDDISDGRANSVVGGGFLVPILT